MSDFSLDLLFFDVQRKHLTDDPAVLAAEVVRRTPDEHLRAAYREMVTDWFISLRTPPPDLVVQLDRSDHTPANPTTAERPRMTKAQEQQPAWRQDAQKARDAGRDVSDWKTLTERTTEEILHVVDLEQGEASSGGNIMNRPVQEQASETGGNASDRQKMGERARDEILGAARHQLGEHSREAPGQEADEARAARGRAAEYGRIHRAAEKQQAQRHREASEREAGES